MRIPSASTGRRGRRVAAPRAAAVAAAVLVLTSCTAGPPAGPGGTATSGTPTASAPGRPNIVLVLTDDLSDNLLPYLPQVAELQRAGATFTDYTVTDSLCCPSRSSILTGRFPHNTGIFRNSGPDGGFDVFRTRGEERQTFAVALQQAGYRTAMMGKYLNGYEPESTYDGTTPYVPPGWNEWDVAGKGYPEFDYALNENHRVVHYGHRPEDYLTDVLAAKGSSFIRAAAAAHTPFLLEIATFAPHGPYTPAPRDAEAFPGLHAPRGPAYDRLPANAPPWLADRPPLSARATARIDTAFRKRAQAVQAVDDLIAGLRRSLADAGVAGDTYLVFTSDNGYHMGEYRLDPGKMTAFDTDIRVPLVVAGPGVPAGVRRAEPVENVDLFPTFTELAGIPTPSTVDGHSLVAPLRGGDVTGWRTAALVEHHGPDHDAADPDRPTAGSGNPPTYQALRTATATYVEYADGQREYYDRRRDPAELDNAAGRLPAATLARWHAALGALTGCHGAAACWAAARLVS